MTVRLVARLPQQQWCGCLAPQRVGQAARDLLDEARELFQEPSRDELSDVLFAMGRLVAATVGRRYLPMPGAGAHIAKITERMNAHGCVRSARHLTEGRCPQEAATPNP